MSPYLSAMLPVKTDVPQGISRLCPGARRSFFCRMKRKVVVSTETSHAGEQIKEEADTTTGCYKRKKQQNQGLYDHALLQIPNCYKISFFVPYEDWKYAVIQCTGYLKSWAPAKISMEEQESENDSENCNLSCLVAVGRLQPTLDSLSLTSPYKLKLRSIKFVSRHTIDGKFLFVDQR